MVRPRLHTSLATVVVGVVVPVVVGVVDVGVVDGVVVGVVVGVVTGVVVGVVIGVVVGVVIGDVVAVVVEVVVIVVVGLVVAVLVGVEEGVVVGVDHWQRRNMLPSGSGKKSGPSTVPPMSVHAVRSTQLPRRSTAPPLQSKHTSSVQGDCMAHEKHADEHVHGSFCRVSPASHHSSSIEGGATAVASVVVDAVVVPGTRSHTSK